MLQDDLFFAELTVRETIAFSATLRLPKSMPQRQKDQRVASIISELGLRDVQDTNVGNDQVRGVSGGERKRVNIGTELVRCLSSLCHSYSSLRVLVLSLAEPEVSSRVYPLYHNLLFGSTVLNSRLSPRSRLGIAIGV